MYGNKRRKIKKKLKILGENINWSKQARYLGVIINKNLSLKNNTDVIVKKTKRIRAVLYPILNRNSKIPMSSRITIMKIYIKTILTYAAAAWGPYLSKSSWNKIETVQYVSIRTITGAHYLTSNANLKMSTGIYSLLQEAKLASKILLHKTSTSRSLHLQQLARKPEIITHPLIIEHYFLQLKKKKKKLITNKN